MRRGKDSINEDINEKKKKIIIKIKAVSSEIMRLFALFFVEIRYYFGIFFFLPLKTTK